MKTFRLAAAVLSFLACAWAHATTLSISPTSQTIAPGASVFIDVTISDVNDGTTPELGAFDLDLGFDAGILSFQNATFGTGLDVFGLGDIQSASETLSGVLNLLEISLDTAEDLASAQPTAFVLATIQFLASGTGTSALTLAINSLSDGEGNSIIADTTSGSITVERGSTGNVPEPATLLLCVAGLLGARMARQRRKV